jgi:cobalt/nickel transport system ATP-binding protein
MADISIRVEGLSYTYPDGWKVLSDVSFELRTGTSVALVGANGCGKTTLLWLIAGLLEAEQGTVYIDEILLDRKNVRTLQKKLGLAFQHPDDQLFMTTVRQDVEFGPRNAGYEEDEISRRAEEAMKRTGCLHLSDRPPYRLSAGRNGWFLLLPCSPPMRKSCSWMSPLTPWTRGPGETPSTF